MDYRKLSIGLATFAGGVAAIAVTAVALGRRSASEAEGANDNVPQPAQTVAAAGPAPAYDQLRQVSSFGDEGHAVPDLAADAEPGARAPEAFRPDMDAPMTPAEREALRPATGPSPTLIDTGTSQRGAA